MNSFDSIFKSESCLYLCPGQTEKALNEVDESTKARVEVIQVSEEIDEKVKSKDPSCDHIDNIVNPCQDKCCHHGKSSEKGKVLEKNWK